MGLSYHLEHTFDGPLDLLLQLITRAKIDIREIFVSSITEQFLAAVSMMEDWPMDLASEFLTMAALLLEIKSRAMLPKAAPIEEEGAESPEEALIRRLTEYKRYKEASEDLRLLEQMAGNRLVKLPEEWIDEKERDWSLGALTLDALSAAFHHAMSLVIEDDPPEEQRVLAREVFTVVESMAHIRARLKNGGARFSELFSECPGREEIVSLFLALLELIRLGAIRAAQEGTYGEIRIELR